MIGDPESVASALRSLSGIKDVDVVQFPSGKELWVVLRDPINLFQGNCDECAVASKSHMAAFLPNFKKAEVVTKNLDEIPSVDRS